MVSTELLRKHKFFGLLNDAQLKAVAMISNEVAFDKGVDILVAEQPADGVFLLVDGAIELYSVSLDPRRPELKKEFLVGEINPGDPFGISALTEPYSSIATVRSSAPCRTIKMDAAALRALCEVDHDLGYALMCQVAKSAVERLAYTQVQLAAAR